jgi:hypothetical protein
MQRASRYDAIMRAAFLFSSILIGCGSSGNGPDGSMNDGGSTDVANGSDGSSGNGNDASDGAAAMPTPLATGLMGQVCCLASDATYVYFLMSGNIYEVPIAGGMPKELSPSNYGTVGTLVPTKDVLYVMFWQGVLGKVALPGGGLTVVLGLAQTQFGAVVSGTTLYWPALFADSINQIDVNGGGMGTVLFPNQKAPIGMAGDSTRLFWVEQGTNGAIVTATLPNGMPQTVGMVQTGPVGALGYDATNVYFIQLGNALAKIPRAGGSATALIGAGMGLPLGDGVNSFTADGMWIWAASDKGIFKVDPSGPYVNVMSQSAAGIISDANNLYWIGNNAIYKSAKP